MKQPGASAGLDAADWGQGDAPPAVDLNLAGKLIMADDEHVDSLGLRKVMDMAGIYGQGRRREAEHGHHQASDRNQPQAFEREQMTGIAE